MRGQRAARQKLPDPPNLRPTILLLDVSPPTQGPVEEITRLAAFAITRALSQANIPDEEPALAHLCDRWETLNTKQIADLGKVLGYILG